MEGELTRPAQERSYRHPQNRRALIRQLLCSAQRVTFFRCHNPADDHHSRQSTLAIADADSVELRRSLSMTAGTAAVRAAAPFLAHAAASQPSGTRTTSNEIAVQRDRAIHRQSPALHGHAGGDCDGCLRQDGSIEHRVCSQGR